MADNNTGLVALKNALSADSVKEQFQRMLGNKSAGFISNIISVAQSNTMFNNVDRNSIILAAAQAASLDLSINPNLGLASIIPYGNQAQMQVQRDGWMELCLRTGQFKSIVNEPVYEGELVEHNRFTDTYVFDETKRVSDKLIGVMASFELTNGYKKVLYMSVEECKEHGKKYSKTFNNPKGLWTSNFLAMSLKGLSLDTMIATPDGYTTMGDIQVGDKVYNALGEVTTVIAKSEVKNLPCYEVTFQNGDSFVCDEEHRWFVKGGGLPKDTEWNVFDTKELYVAKALGYPVVMPKNPVIVGEEKELPIDPYILGYWLGNGSKCAAVVCCDEDDADEISAKFEEYYEVNQRHDTRSRGVVLNISSKTGGRKDGSSLKQQLKEAGVYGNKHIPEMYLRASVEQRLELVRGLMDSDGCIYNNRGRAAFTSTRQELSDGLYALLSSLGERACRSSHIARGYGVTTVAHQVDWQPIMNPFNLKRKAERVRPRLVETTNVVKSVVKVESVPTQCIAVDSGDATEENDLRKSFLIGEGCYVTHNTVLKKLLKKYAPKSIEYLNKAMEIDQAAFTGTIDNPQPVYVDNQNNAPHAEEVHDFQEADVVNEQTGEVLQNGGEPQTTMFDK